MHGWARNKMRHVANHPVITLIGLVAAIITIVSFSFFSHKPNGIEADREKPPSQTQPESKARVPVPIRTDEDRERLRRAHGVRKIHSLEEGMSINRLPNGIFGFISASELSFILLGLDRPEWIALNIEMDRITDMEIHKTSRGALFVLVYMDEGQLLQLQDPERAAALASSHPDSRK